MSKKKAEGVDLTVYRKAAGDLSDEQDQADQSIALLQELIVASETDLAFASEILLDVKAKHSELESRRKSVVQPLNGVVREINSWFKPVRDRLETAERILKAKLAGYIEAREEANREALATASTAETGAEAAAALATIEDVATAPGTSTRKVWRFRVVDAQALPREWLVPNVEAIAGYAKAAKGEPHPIAGVEFFQETIVVASRGA